MEKLLLLIIFLKSVAIDAAHVPRCDSEAFKHPKIPGATVLSITAEERRDVTTPAGLAGPSVSGLDFCDVKVHITHPGTDDNVLIQTWLPLAKDDWNGRFLATGGGGWATGFFDVMLGAPIKAGYAASSTDGGHQGHPGEVTWALNPDRSVNWHLLHNFATKSPADQVYVGKSITEQYFGTAPHHSYWNGCSQGGRQGYEIAQKYPSLLDGISANAPALDAVNIWMGDFWPQLVMSQAGSLMSECEFDRFLKQAIEKCDILDGVRDGIIEDPEICNFDPGVLVGQKIQCEGKEIDITKVMAEVVRKIWQGPRTPFGENIWHGLPHGTPMDWIGNIEVSGEGVRSPKPFPVANSFIQNLLLRDPSFNTTTLTYTDYIALWAQGNEQYGWILNSGNHNLKAFHEAGGKLLTWHGTNDQVIPYQNTLRYRERVETEMGGSKAVGEFYRVFLAPGVHHCGLGAGPPPTDALEALVDWVENGEPPETLLAAVENERGDRISRDLCPYPKKTKYMGLGDGYRASNWICEGGNEDEAEVLEEPNGGRNFLGGLRDRLTQVGLDMGLNIG